MKGIFELYSPNKPGPASGLSCSLASYFGLQTPTGNA